MGFNSVYRGLMDVFPQIDSRILRAVAIENSKDIDKAAEVVLMEVLPYMFKGATTSDSSNDSPGNANCADREDDAMQLGLKNMNEIVGGANASSSHDANGGGDQSCQSDWEKTVLPADSSMVMGPNQSLHVMSTISECDDGNSNLDCQIESNLQELCSNSNLLDAESFTSKCAPPMVHECPSDAESFAAKQAPPMFHECPPDALVLGVHHTDGMIPEETEIPDHAPVECVSTCKEVGNGHESMSDLPTHEVVDFELEPSLTTEGSRSDQICRIDLLEDIIEGARDNKKTLFSAMESVISLMREVELREKAAEQLKEEAVKGDLDILTRVEDLKQMLRHAKEANDMHAGEVYGERAILATEAKELQSRLLSLSDERDKSLAILVEMRQTVEQRLDAAEKEMKEAEQEKMKKEESARNALAEQELIMEKVVQESKMLKQEAEENSKLREFLMDRGLVVDVLQGEISVICKDVRLLKEKFDERAPLSESITSSQTSCRLASSSSSIKSLGPDQVPLQTEVTIETLEKSSAVPFNGQISPREEREANDREAVADEDGWEFFDKDNGWED